MAKKISQKSLVRLFKDTHENEKSDLRFCFLLGAGASRSSGIPTGAGLAEQWYAEIKDDLTAEKFSVWKSAIGLNEELLADFYPQIFEKRFIERRAGYEFLQHLMDNAKPSPAYTILANILVETNHNMVITTNFDYLLEDAMVAFTDTHPLVCGHEALAPFVNTYSSRPTIIKLHRGLLLDPFNDASNVNQLKQEWDEVLKSTVSNYHLVVIGYGGYDGSLMEYLRAIPEENRESIYWCTRHPEQLNGKIKALLKEKDKVVTIAGFDKLMYELRQVFGFELPIDPLDIENSKIIKVARSRAEQFKKTLDELGNRAVAKSRAGIEISSAEREMLPGWWICQLDIDKEAQTDGKNKLYQEGLRKYPESHELMNNYALFLQNQSKEAAEHYYLKALELDEDNAVYMGNYALFSWQDLGKNDQAETYFVKALKLDPGNANVNGNYATFLWQTRHKQALEAAQRYYRQALTHDPKHVNHNANFAGFLLAFGEREEAEPYLKRALERAENESLKLELQFYLLAHFPEKHDAAKKEIESLLAKGVRSTGWDFSDNIARAEKEGCTYADELKALAERITGRTY